MTAPDQMTEKWLLELLLAGKTAAENGSAAVSLCRGIGSRESRSPIGRAKALFGFDERAVALIAYYLYELVENGRIPSQERYRALSQGLGRSGADPLPELMRWGPQGVELSPVGRDYLLMRDPELPAGARLVFCTRETSYHSRDTVDEICAFLRRYAQADETRAAAVFLVGASGCGRRFLLGQAAERLGSGLLLLGEGRTAPRELPLSRELPELALAAMLYNAFLCVEGYTARDEGLLRALESRLPVIFLISENPAAVPGRLVLQRHIEPLTREERLNALEDLLKPSMGGKTALLAEAAGLYPLEAGQLRAAAARLAAESYCRPGAEITAEELMAALREQNTPAFTDYARQLSTGKRLGDLVLPAAQKQELTELCAVAKARFTVYQDWGFEEKIPYGRGISILFYGASGTGKTLAASVLANELGLELYRVDLAQITSKYVGETQKNIGRIFDEAQRRGCILFFDEADAIFAKRAEVNDAQDKYANGEVAYLLQKTEQFEGITVLATNLFQNFDEAFRRRITFMLRFPMPEARERELLWRGIFPEKAPVKELDYGLLAEQFELSGAGIKNCAVYAALLAGAAGTPIGMEQVVQAVRKEYEKLGKTISPRLLQLFSADTGRQ